MTDITTHVMTLTEIVKVENLVRPLDVLEWESVLNLCASHRTLHKRHRLLLRRVEELEGAIAKATVIVEDMVAGRRG